LNQEEQNIEIRKKLLNLQRVKASSDFENNLLRRLNSIEAGEVKPEVKKTGVLDFIFGKKTLVWAVPAGSLAVLLIIYFTVIRNESMKDTTAFQNGKPQEQTIQGEQKSAQNTETGKSDIPGKDIVNDLEIGKTDSKEKDKTLQKGFIETAPEIRTEKPAPETGRTKPETKEAEEEIKTPDAIKSDAPKKNETPKKTEIKETAPVKPAEKEVRDEPKPKKDEGYDATRKNENVKDEKGKEESGKTLLPEKKITSPLIDDSKKKTGKDSTKKDESKSKKKEMSKELLEELKKKINENQ
jgi:hypothetical protein